jgi:hypothetical protein
LHGDTAKRLRYKAWRAAKRAMWVPLRTLIHEATQIGAGAEEIGKLLRRVGEHSP